MNLRLRCLRLLAPLVLICCNAACQNLSDSDLGDNSSEPQQVLITFVQGKKGETSLLNSFRPGYHRSDYGGALSTRLLVAGVLGDYALDERSGWVIDTLGLYCGLFDVAPGIDVEGLLRELNSDPRIESAQHLYHYVTRADSGYDDPYFELQYGSASPYILRLHEWSTGKGVQVAVIDTGIDTRHPDLRQQIVASHQFVVADGRSAGANIHGTAMAGIIAARANNGSGIVGIAPNARIHALQACRQVTTNSSLAYCDSFSLARALDFAIEARTDIINLSLSGPRDPLVTRLVEVALSRGQVVAAADPGAGEQRYPARLRGVIAVRESDGGSPSPAADSDELVVLAPRRELLSTGPGGRYDFYSGSSAATAVVSGLTALLLERKEHMSSEGRVAWLNEAMRREIGPATGVSSRPHAATTAGLAETTIAPQPGS